MMRECGGCTLCCKLLPVPPLDKKAGERCRFVRTGKGCSVHHTPKQPRECGLWHCRWLVNDEAGDLPRPDRAHYVIDIMPDEMVISDDETGFRRSLAAIQIWGDPAHRDEIMRDAKLRAWIARKAEQGIPTLLRFGTREAIGVFAPVMSSDNEWHFKGGTINPELGLWK